MNIQTKMALTHLAALLVPAIQQILTGTGNPYLVVAAQVIALAFSAFMSHNDLATKKLEVAAPVAPVVPASVVQDATPPAL